MKLNHYLSAAVALFTAQSFAGGMMDAPAPVATETKPVIFTAGYRYIDGSQTKTFMALDSSTDKKFKSFDAWTAGFETTLVGPITTGFSYTQTAENKRDVTVDGATVKQGASINTVAMDLGYILPIDLMDGLTTSANVRVEDVALDVGNNALLNTTTFALGFGLSASYFFYDNIGVKLSGQYLNPQGDAVKFVESMTSFSASLAYKL